MPSRTKRSKSQTRINNNRLCPQANDILKQVQTQRRVDGRGKIPIRILNDEAVVGYYAGELNGKDKLDKGQDKPDKPTSRKSTTHT